ncbi:MAG: type VI secretion system baseplate subunit TssG [Gemmatimonadaceae bacterium]|nr:type VI secretion system baseplate subunit TssG [Gemmatimonadaceae bacterium]
MGTEVGVEDDSVEPTGVADALRNAPNTFSFFQAVRLLQRLRPERGRVGLFGEPQDEVVRFTVPPSIAFPASEIQTLDQGGAAPAVMAVNFFGLIGPQGVLPYQYSIATSEQNRARNRAPQAFFDLFHHRLLSFFYRTWEKYRFDVSSERGDVDQLAKSVRCLLGVGTTGLQERLGVRDEALLFFSGLIGPTQRSAIALERLLSEYFGVDAAVEQFVGGWYTLTPGSMCRLGDESDASSQLGIGVVVGDEMWDQQARARIRLGPLTRAQFERFLPEGSAFAELRDLTRFFSGDGIDFDVQLVLRREDVPPLVLGASTSLRLGWGSFVSTRAFLSDVDDTTFSL